MSNNIQAKATQIYSSHVTSVFIMLLLLLFIWLNSSGKLKSILSISGGPSLVGEIPGGAIVTDYGNAQSKPGTVSSNEQTIRNALTAAGFTAGNVDVMTAIGKAESGLRSEATANTSKEYSVGPFQINLKAHPYIPEAEARNPVTAAQWAYKLSGGSNFQPWTTYTSGKYKQFLK
jgi:hypothetical protein